MTILVCGDRNWNNLERILDVLRQEYPKATLVVEGEARGADTQGRLAAERLGIPVRKFPAQWNLYGRAAGPIRNAQMLREGKPDVVLAFHNHISESRGTRHMMGIARKAGILVRLFTEKGEVQATSSSSA